MAGSLEVDLGKDTDQSVSEARSVAATKETGLLKADLSSSDQSNTGLVGFELFLTQIPLKHPFRRLEG